MDSVKPEGPSGPVHLDTVRALHQTVVSLRTALELSKNELKQLKEKYEQHSHCLEYADVIEKLTLENHILRRKIIDSGFEDPNAQNIRLEVTYSPRSQHPEDYTSSEIVIATATDGNITADEPEPIARESDENSNVSSDVKLVEISEEVSGSPELNISGEITAPDITNNNTDVGELSQIPSLPRETELSEEQHQPSFKTKLELLSKFDVRIKVRTLKEGSVISSTTSESDSSEFKKDFDKDSEDKREKTEKKDSNFEVKSDPFDNNKTIHIKSYSTDNIRMAVPNEADVKSKTDKFDVQVKITSEENLVVKENVERSRRKDTLNLDVDDLSLRSMSEGDNSVFSEGGTTPKDPNAATVTDDKNEDNASGNESEEVDDIELIFTTDESKDMSNLQEDLVSIRETDQWGPPSSSTTHSTPVLIKFHTLDPDFQPGTETKDTTTDHPEKHVPVPETLKVKRVSLPNDKEIKHVAFNAKGNLEIPNRSILKSCDNKSDNMLYRRSPNTSSRRLDSVDSLTCEYNQGMSFDNTKSSSFELGSSMDILHRDESVDSFHRNIYLGHRYSVFAETDISKCGTSEDDLAMNLNVRRNTCPNPFQYRPSAYRGVTRTPGPFKAVGTRLRPVLRDSTHARRESGAQTDVCALPNRWSSDGYLAHKLPAPPTSVVPTVPRRGSAQRGRLNVPAPAPTQQDARRVLLSDIGFTSMVPELSRSADPVWALGKLQPHPEESITTSTSKDTNFWPSMLSIASSMHRPWRSSLPDVRYDDTEELLHEAETFVRRSIDNLHSPNLDVDRSQGGSQVMGQPYIPAEPRQLRLGHTVKVITPQGRIAVGRVRYVGLAGGSAANSSVVVGAEFVHAAQPGLPRNDGTHRGRRYFLAPPQHTALFVPFSKVVMAWAN
ncbi:unnamed protein product [Arctia plantaginis]|uniref:CAP-Gly domain-containing protein n=1 Tax=Arctia plantaginis TaxID=874455 RepID=A0A8S1B586_ARCPL|nr:unnamed protein product [Arctia plantaginis]